MKTQNFYMVFLVGLLCCAWASAVTAQVSEPNASGRAKIKWRRVQPDLGKWDLNHDGRLDAAELEAYRRDKARERDEKFESERRAVYEARKLEHAWAVVPPVVPSSLLSLCDTNHDGLIDPGEWARYKAELRRKRAAAARSAAAPIHPNGISSVRAGGPSVH